MAIMGAIRGIVFDKDGTLFHYDATWLPVNRLAAQTVAGGDAVLAERLLVAGGYDPSRGTVRPDTPLAAGNAAEIAALWAAEVPGRGAAELTILLDRIFVEEGLAHAAPVADLAALFRRLRDRGLVLGIATNDSLAAAAVTVGRFGLTTLVDFLAGYDAGYGAKPEPGMIRAFCAETGLDPREVAVVGDNLHDLEMGRSGGAGLLVGVLTGTGSREVLTPVADHVIESVAELEGLLDSPCDQA
jgi:phosphoglycolate phosphatase